LFYLTPSFWYSSMSWVVMSISVIGGIGPGLGSGPTVLSIHVFGFQNSENARGCGVVFFSQKEHLTMARRRGHTDEQILAALRLAEGGMTQSWIRSGWDQKSR
jgi:hypothetical protein